MHSRGCSHRCTSIRCAHTFSASHLRFSGSVCSLRGDVQRPPSPARHARLSSSSAVVRSYCSVTPLVPLPFLARASLPFVACALSHASPHCGPSALSTTFHYSSRRASDLAEPQISPSLRSRRASDLAEQLALALQEGVELRFRLLGAHENVGDHLVRDSLLSRLRR